MKPSYDCQWNFTVFGGNFLSDGKDFGMPRKCPKVLRTFIFMFNSWSVCSPCAILLPSVDIMLTPAFGWNIDPVLCYLLLNFQIARPCVQRVSTSRQCGASVSVSTLKKSGGYVRSAPQKSLRSASFSAPLLPPSPLLYLEYLWRIVYWNMQGGDILICFMPHGTG